MILQYYGHSLFTMAFENGTTLLTDPYGDFYDYPKRTLKADIVTISHHHHDHDAVDMVEGTPQVIDTAGVFSPNADLIITGVPSKHDAQNGAQRGDNLIFVIMAEGLKIVHMGDIGHVINDRQRHAIGKPDILLLPVGGYYTTDAKAAIENIHLLEPRVSIPMHYRTRFNESMPIQTVQPFFEMLKVTPDPMPLIRFTGGDLNQRPPVMMLSITDRESK